MAATKIRKSIEMNTLASAKTISKSKSVKNVFASLGYLKRNTDLQNLIIKIAICPIILNTLSTVTESSSISYSLSPVMALPSFSLANDSE
jgi:hypothetical protein